MWQRYNEVYQLNAHVLPMSLLRINEDGGTINSEINAIKRADIRGLQLIQELLHLYTRYALDQQRAQSNQTEHENLPVIVCSELLV